MVPERSDSAGVPWSGRAFQANKHAHDDGSTPVALRDALAAFSTGAASAVNVVDAFRTARLLIPLIARLGDTATPDNDRHDDKTIHRAPALSADPTLPVGTTEGGKSQELAIVTVAGPDGRSALPVFSSVERMQSWNPTARPVPADGVRVALAAAGDGTELVVLDPGSPDEFVLRRPAVWAVAQSQPWQPAHCSANVLAAFRAVTAQEPAVIELTLTDGDPTGRLTRPELEVLLRLRSGLARPDLDALLSRLSEGWAADPVIAASVDSLAVKLNTAIPWDKRE